MLRIPGYRTKKYSLYVPGGRDQRKSLLLEHQIERAKRYNDRKYHLVRGHSAQKSCIAGYTKTQDCFLRVRGDGIYAILLHGIQARCHC